jgi:acyl-CoA thioester hydrolase
MPFIAETTFYVRYVENDAQGVVNHTHYLAYLEEGRSIYIRQRGHSYAAMEAAGHVLAVTDVQVRYHRAAVYDNQITVRTWLVEARSRTVTFQYEILRTETGEVLVTGTTKHICLDRTGAVSRLPETWRQWMD